MKMKLAVLFSTPFLLAASGTALAQDYPTKNIQIIVPYSAGGGGDTVARIIADRLSDELGRQVNVVNREGAGGEIGIAEIARSQADGYTLGVFGYPDNFVLENTRDTSFDSDSFEYLAAFDDMPMGIFSGPGSDLDTLDAVRSYGEENPGAIVIGESGALGLLNILAFSEELGIDTTPIRYSGGGELMNALLGNHIDLASTSSMSHDPITDAGGTPIGFAAAERMEMFPDVPTLKEQGIDLEMGVSRVMVAPAGLPDDVRDILTSALDEISTNEAMIENFRSASIPYRYLNADEASDMVERSNSVLSPVIEENLEQFNDD
ncbi:tripartite tricarboxylate transporter substrate binding protein [Halomonas sp. BC04]|uniref:tripartite tricarboxylate transporter substrate binding protein n=1 Tax=Halomonas sp. BC04 TaxID=1403540 RepID=UPI0005BA56F4|nr:tripartite tricarboxylate transporter substrate binding protein [Halomonas sp. BC04]